MEVLEYQLKHAPVRENAKWLAQLRKQGTIKSLPGAHEESEEEDDTPKLVSGSFEIWVAFTDLSSQRTYATHGPQAIPYTEVDAWANLHDVGVYDRPFMSSMIVKMDRAYLEHTYAQMKRERERQQSAANAPLRRGR